MALVQRDSDVDPRVCFGDRVLLYETFDRMKAFDVTRGAAHHTKAGIFRAEDLVGVAYGSKVYDTKGKGYLFVLRVTPELWTLAVKHQTQIVHISDISMVTFYLGIRPGSVVVESGTGTGSMSTSLIRSVFPTGHLYTFEYNESRADIARETFRQNGVSEYVTVQHRDVLKDGFGDDLENRVDAMFLDLPAPWDAIKHARKVLKENARLCSYSPCIEQVQRTCSSLRNQGFEVITTIECLIRKFESRRQRLPGPLRSCQQTGSIPSGVEQKADSNATNDVSAPKKRRSEEDDDEQPRQRRPTEEEPEQQEQNQEEDRGEEEEEETNGDGDEGSRDQGMADASNPSGEARATTAEGDTRESGRRIPGADTPFMRRIEFPAHPQGLVQTRPWPEMRGHTAYLTFARKELPKAAKRPPVE